MIMGLKKVTTLSDIIRYGRTEPRQMVRLWIDVLRVLAAKHREGVFFGILNPKTVLIDMTNHIVLTESPTDKSSPYLAPEMAAGSPPDEQSDVYSMGVMFFEMLTGSLEGLHRKPPSRVSEGVPRWIDPIVLRCIMEQRSQRYLDLEELSQDLKKLKANIQALQEKP
jgi:serine/threonine protein kinase